VLYLARSHSPTSGDDESASIVYIGAVETGYQSRPVILEVYISLVGIDTDMPKRVCQTWASAKCLEQGLEGAK